MARVALLVLLLVQSAASLLLGSSAPMARASVATFHPRTLPEMKVSDEEFEEFMQKKLGNVKKLGSDENFGEYRRAEGRIYKVGGAITLLVPIIGGVWAYNAGYLTPQ
uniref:Uncharacterized protein n=1 Tax=Haptolina ericina TaxID=156174 RepID=A0A7S3BAI7_9EUKA|mmetsp:Transcript_53051/g.119045  ORF Transcript_53051/g.119045 Transcript_53051/m.119045 type:complete len:108 (+) Transcript_53051:35-358(+)